MLIQISNVPSNTQIPLSTNWRRKYKSVLSI